MATINRKRVMIGALAGTIVWILWGVIVNFAVLGKRYEAAQQAGIFLKEPRYPAFPIIWILMLYALSYGLAWLYAGARNTFGPGPKTALKIGLFVGFAAGFPLSFSTATFEPLDRIFPLWWMLELWIGAMASCFISGWLYRET